jgi:hypothetical protein
LNRTPHIGSVCRGLYPRFYRDTVANVSRMGRGGPPLSLFEDGEGRGMALMMTISNAEYDTNDAILPVERRS